MSRVVLKNVVEDFTKMPQEKQEEYSEMFCEGNKDLKALMLKMWKNGIQTYASCAGHDKSELKSTNGLVANLNPYIYFDVKSLDEKQQKKLYKNLILKSKTTDLINKFDLALDNYMGFEKHGLRINLKKDEESYKMLNEIFDDVFKKETVFDNVKNLFNKEANKAELTKEEVDFIKSIIKLNEISLEEFIEATKNLEENSLSFMNLEYKSNGEMNFTTRDSIKTASIIVENGNNQEVIPIAEGYYTQDPLNENTFYTLKNGEEVKLQLYQILSLKQLKEERKFHFTKEYQATSVNKYIQKILDEVEYQREINL